MTNNRSASGDAAPSLRLQGRFLIDDQLLFDQLTLDLPAGRWTCLLGSSGIGKSTILRLIAGLPTGGVFDGTISASDQQDLTGRVAFMAQADLLAPWLTVAQNIALGHRLRGHRLDPTRLEQIIGQVGLSAHAGKRPAELSGGMRQRAALARTLVRDTPFVLLDEPFSALDARTRADMQELAWTLLAGRTVMLVTHDPAEAARLGERIVLMRRNGLHPIEAPDNPPIRAVDDAQALMRQGELTVMLREPEPG